MRQVFVSHVAPALAALWPVLIHRHSSSSSSSSHEESKSCGDNDVFIVSDIVRLRYLTIINEYVARGEMLWLLPSSSSQHSAAGDSTTGDHLEFVRSAKLVLSRFRISVLYGSLHPLFADGLILRRRLGDPQTPGAFGTVLELTRLLLACIDDRTTTVMQTDGSIQLLIEADSVEEEGSGGGGDHVQYNPWPVLCSILLSDTGFYEAKLAVLEWLTEHAENERMEIFGRLGVSANLLPALIADIDSATPVRDPVVRSASIRLLSCLCAKLEISPSSFPVDDLVSFWDRISAQLSSSPISVALALTELQATLVHMVYAQQQQQQQVSDDNDGAHSRLRAWANHLYEWADPERAHPYRLAVGRSLVVYSTIKRFYETTVEVDSASEEILRLCYWRVLQDDDEEIRDYVAQSISRRLGRQLGCDQACERLIADFDEPLTFPHTYVTNRLAYLLGPLHLSTDSTLDGVEARKEAVRAMVEVAVNPSRVLFDHEPPNIYIDQSRNLELAYYSLVTIAASSSNRLSDYELGVFIEGAMHCVEALDAARMAISTIPGGSGEATMLSSLYSLIQSWILGARLAVFVATRLKGDNGDTIVARVKEVVDAWLNPKSDSVLLHPWIARALSSLDDLCICAKASGGGAISKDRAVSDLFLLTFI
ncbi:hypothetical protein GGF42_000240 [Coemansia sp. RSA 2424]|nr:hypothetical protein GGF42_000240 [Coemansia sp. RSA 2424]